MGTLENEVSDATNENETVNNFFPSLSADNETGLTELESLCINCEEEV